MTILDRLRDHAKTIPDQTAFVFLKDLNPTEVLTFGQLENRVSRLAHRLKEFAAKGDRALLLFPPGLEFIVGFLACLKIGIIAVPAYPPRKNRKQERLNLIYVNASPLLALTTDSLKSHLEQTYINTPFKFHIITTNEKEWYSSNFGDSNVSVKNDDIAFIQYTSGSTSNPKGVIITHKNIISNEKQIEQNFKHTSESIMVSWLPAFHDMGLVGCILQPLYVGFPSILFSPVEFLQKPLNWLKAVTRYKATTTGGPNFAFALCTKFLAENDKNEIDLSSLKIAFNGAEPIRSETLENFSLTFKSNGFRPESFFPCYGLAESTLFISGGPLDTNPTILNYDREALEKGKFENPKNENFGRVVGCGTPDSNTVVLSVDPFTKKKLPEGQVGELWVSSPSIAKGYWGETNENCTNFNNFLLQGEGPFLNTGDLGFLFKGEIFITGRSKDMIIIAGRNIYPQDIELAILNELNLKNGKCAAFSLTFDYDEKVCAVIECDMDFYRKIKAEASCQYNIFSRIRNAVNIDCFLTLSAILFVKPNSFPLTSSGKIPRLICKDLFKNKKLNTVAEWSSFSI